MIQDVFCLWKQSKRREFEKFEKLVKTFDTIGRVHLDSLELYSKYTYEERHTYRLDAIVKLKLVKRKLYMKALIL